MIQNAASKFNKLRLLFEDKEVSMKDAIGNAARTCLIYEGMNTLNIMQLGFFGFMPHSATFYINGEEKRTPCGWCKHGLKQELGNCSPFDFCPGFTPTIGVDGFNEDSLISHLERIGSDVSKTHDRGYEALLGTKRITVLAL